MYLCIYVSVYLCICVSMYLSVYAYILLHAKVSRTHNVLSRFEPKSPSFSGGNVEDGVYKSVLSNFWYYALFFSFLAFPVVSVQILRSFSCTDLGKPPTPHPTPSTLNPKP